MSAAPPAAAAAPGPIENAIVKFLNSKGSDGKPPKYLKATDAIKSAGEWNRAIKEAAAPAAAAPPPPPSIEAAIKDLIKQANIAADQYIQKVNDASGDKSKIDVITTDDLKAKYKAAGDQLTAGKSKLGASAKSLEDELAAVKTKVDNAKAGVLTGGRRRKATRKATKKSKKSRKTKKSKRSRKSKGRK